MSVRTLLMASAALAFAVPAAAQVQPSQVQSPAPADDEIVEEEEEIVVTGQRPRGSVIGDIPPERTLDSRDVRATGATNINELLEALAPEIGSARGRGGGRPVLLLNGQRISGFRELRDIPTEAIQRVEVLPEEVALKYGYRAEQRVVNIVLRRRFRSTVALVEGSAATEGGYAGGEADLTRLMIQRNGRTTINLHAEGNGLLTEAERDVLGDDGDSEFRSLLPARRLLRGSATLNRQLFGDVSATVNGELEHSTGRSLIGFGDLVLEGLERDTRSDSAHLGAVLNGDKAGWRWSLTGNGDIVRDVTGTDRDNVSFNRDRARTTATSGDLTGTANGKLFTLPAGNATTTLRVGVDAVDLDAERRRVGVTTSSSLGRTRGNAAVNVDLPIARRNRALGAIGNLTLNANAEVEQLSDFGTLTTIGAGANWSPVERLNLLTSWTREDGAPTIQQLGNPILETPGTRIFDFTTGETVLATVVTGGNPDLQADRRNVFKLGANWQPLEEVNLRLRADYVRSRLQDVISGLDTTPALESAFPDRFVRDAGGNLVSADLRPVNFDSARRDTLRLGIDFSKPLRSRRPPQSVIDSFRRQAGGSAPRPGRTDDGAAPSPPAGEAGEGRERGFGRFGGGGGGPFGGRNRGRLQFSLTDTINLVDRVTVRPGLPDINYLGGDAVGQSGGRPRHEIEGRAGWSNNGLGARLSANWRSGTEVESLGGDELRFSPLATFDLRLFANLGEQFALVQKHPWLRGSSVRFEIDNLFDAKPRVRNAAGDLPLNYQPDLLDPLGRTISISFRKLFLPPRSFFQRQRQQEREPQQTR